MQFYESILTYRQQTLHLRGLGKNSQLQRGQTRETRRSRGAPPSAGHARAVRAVTIGAAPQDTRGPALNGVRGARRSRGEGWRPGSPLFPFPFASASTTDMSCHNRRYELNILSCIDTYDVEERAKWPKPNKSATRGNKPC